MIPMRRIERQAQIADAVAGIRISSSPLHYLEVEPSASRTPRSMNCLQVSGVSLLEALQRQPQVDPSHRLELRTKQLAVWRPPSSPAKGVHRRPEAALREPFDLELDLVCLVAHLLSPDAQLGARNGAAIALPLVGERNSAREAPRM